MQPNQQQRNNLDRSLRMQENRRTYGQIPLEQIYEECPNFKLIDPVCKRYCLLLNIATSVWMRLLFHMEENVSAERTVIELALIVADNINTHYDISNLKMLIGQSSLLSKHTVFKGIAEEIDKLVRIRNKVHHSPYGIIPEEMMNELWPQLKSILKPIQKTFDDNVKPLLGRDNLHVMDTINNLLIQLELTFDLN